MEPKRVVIQCIVLCIVPQGGDGVAVVVAHGQSGGVSLRRGVGDRRQIRQARNGGAVRRADRDREQVHLAVVERKLLGVVVVILVPGGRCCGSQTERIRRVRVHRGDVVGVVQVRIRGEQGRGADVVGGVGRGWREGRWCRCRSQR